MGAGEFKAKCLSLLDDVAKTGRPLVVTKRGRPVAKVIPAGRATASKEAPLEGSIVWEGDVVSPIDSSWEADRRRRKR